MILYSVSTSEDMFMLHVMFNGVPAKNGGSSERESEREGADTNGMKYQEIIYKEMVHCTCT